MHLRGAARPARAQNNFGEGTPHPLLRPCPFFRAVFLSSPPVDPAGENKERKKGDARPYSAMPTWKCALRQSQLAVE